MALHAVRSRFSKLNVSSLFCRVRNYFVRSANNIWDARILGIETSCDDTGVGVVDGIGNILGDSLYSQELIHLRHGGINPLTAYDLHRINIESAVSEALNKADMDMKDINAIAVTTKPGLKVSLEVGVKYAKYLAKKFFKPLIPIHHMEAHALVARMFYDLPFPYITLLVSGGHCQLALVREFNDFVLLGETIDNAPGEIMDKAARRMKLRNLPEYSKVGGGKAIEDAAKKAQVPEIFDFPMPMWKYRDCNFSFSGLKDSLERKLLKKEYDHGILGDCVIPEVHELCASFQLAIAEHLALKTERAVRFCELYELMGNTKNIVVSGGVACNDFIFKSIQQIGRKTGYNVYRPPPQLCTDNGIMVAWNGVEKFRKQVDITLNLSKIMVDPKATLGNSIIDKVREANLSVKKTKLKDLYKA